MTAPTEFDPVSRPMHYNVHPSGVECIDITKHMNYCLGNAMKYIWRAGLKTDDPTTDLRKAKQYLEWEIERYAQPAGDAAVVRGSDVGRVRANQADATACEPG